MIVFGAIVLVLRGVSYVKDKDKTDLGIATVTMERRGFIPPWSAAWRSLPACLVVRRPSGWRPARIKTRGLACEAPLPF